VISLSVKTLLNHVGSKLFLLNSAWFLSVKSYGHAEFLMLELAFLCFSTQSVIFFETRNIVYLSVAGVSCELCVGRLLFDCGFVCFDVFVSCAR
jgi:hypothetical protein